MLSARTVHLLLPLALATAGLVFGQTATPPVHTLTIQVGDKPALVLTEDDLLKMPQHTASIKEHGEQATYTGVSLHDVLSRAGAPVGNQLHGRALSSYILASAKDGYQAVFTLTETDPSFTDGETLIADRMNGTPLPETQGPFRIVVANDKKPARSVRMLEKIEVVQLRH